MYLMKVVCAVDTALSLLPLFSNRSSQQRAYPPSRHAPLSQGWRLLHGSLACVVRRRSLAATNVGSPRRHGNALTVWHSLRLVHDYAWLLHPLVHGHVMLAGLRRNEILLLVVLLCLLLVRGQAILIVLLLRMIRLLLIVLSIVPSTSILLRWIIGSRIGTSALPSLSLLLLCSHHSATTSKVRIGFFLLSIPVSRLAVVSTFRLRDIASRH